MVKKKTKHANTQVNFKNLGDCFEILILNTCRLSSFNVIPLEVKRARSFSKFNKSTYLF